MTAAENGQSEVEPADDTAHDNVRHIKSQLIKFVAMTEGHDLLFLGRALEIAMMECEMALEIDGGTQSISEEQSPPTNSG